LAQAKSETKHYDLEHIASVYKRFYTLIIGEAAPVSAMEPEAKTRKPRADKSNGPAGFLE
jgi:hypothetical protein